MLAALRSKRALVSAPGSGSPLAESLIRSFTTRQRTVPRPPPTASKSSPRTPRPFPSSATSARPRRLDLTPVPRSQRAHGPRPSRPPQPARQSDPAADIPPADSYQLASRTRFLIQRGKLDEAVNLVIKEKEVANAVVWNLLLSATREIKRPSDVYTLFMQMKKRGYVPNSRSYTVLFRALAGDGQHEPSAKAQAAAHTVYKQLQSYQTSLVSEVNAPADELSVTPINGYLSVLAQLGHTRDLLDVYEQLPESGPLAPDVFTYTILFQGLLKSGKGAEDAELGRRLWLEYAARLDAAPRPEAEQVRVEGPRDIPRVWHSAPKALAPEVRLQPDSTLISLVLRVLRLGGEREHTLGLNIATSYLGVAPASPYHTPAPAAHRGTIPLNNRLIDSLFHLGLSANRPELVLRHADHVLADPAASQQLTTRVMYTVLLACATKGEAGKAEAYVSWMSSRRGNAVRPDLRSYDQAISACWRAKDWPRAAKLFGQLEAAGLEPDVRLMATLVNAALATGEKRHMQAALRILGRYSLESFFATLSSGGQATSAPVGSRKEDKHRRFWEGKLAWALEQVLQTVVHGDGEGRTRELGATWTRWLKLVQEMRSNMDAQHGRARVREGKASGDGLDTVDVLGWDQDVERRRRWDARDAREARDRVREGEASEFGGRGRGEIRRSFERSGPRERRELVRREGDEWVLGGLEDDRRAPSRPRFGGGEGDRRSWQ